MGETVWACLRSFYGDTGTRSTRWVFQLKVTPARSATTLLLYFLHARVRAHTRARAHAADKPQTAGLMMMDGVHNLAGYIDFS